MELLNSDYNIAIHLDSTYPTVVIIKNPSIMYSFVYDFQKQVYGGAGSFGVKNTVDAEDINWDNIDILTSPFELGKKYQQLTKEIIKSADTIAKEELWFARTRLESEVADYIYSMKQCTGYPMIVNLKFDDQMIWELLGMKMQLTDEMHLQDQIKLYIRTLASLQRKKILVLVNIKDYLEQEYLQEIYQVAASVGISIIIIERQGKYWIEQEHNYFIS